MTSGTSKGLRARFHADGDKFEPFDAEQDATQVQSRADDEEFQGYCKSIWQTTFQNLNFAPLTTSHSYYKAIQHRLKLFHRIIGKKHGKQCFSLPDRYFHFVPLLPRDRMNYPGENEVSFRFVEESDDEDEMDIDHNHDHSNMHEEIEDEMDDPPPVEFTCDSFTLTSPTSDEYVLLNPFSGSIEVHGVLDNAVGGEERIMEAALRAASENIMKSRRSRMNLLPGTPMSDLDECSEDIAGETIHSHLAHKMYDTPPRQVLFSVDDYFELNLEEYFGQDTPFGKRFGTRAAQGNVTVDWVGVDAHVAMKDSSITGTLIGAARILTSEADEELTCTEVFAWSNFESKAKGYATKYVCRSVGSFYFLDICANTHKLYATFQSVSGFENDTRQADVDRHRPLMEIDDNSLVNEDGEPIRMSQSIFCFPLVKYNTLSEGNEEVSSYFPSPEACITAQYPVSSFSVDVTGKILVVGTIHGTIELWNTGMHQTSSRDDPRRLEILSVRESFLRRARSMTMGARFSVQESSGGKPNVEFDANAAEELETQDDLALIGDDGVEELPHKHPTSKISQVYIPRHLPVHRCGFVTKQRNSESGTTLLLWQTPNMSSANATNITDHFEIVSMINLPISARCHAEVHYDGRRLIVFGQDHIGLIFLVYHVLSTRYDQNEFDEQLPFSRKKSRGKGEESGGVINLFPDDRRIKFVNRIRHAGLGGLEYFDSLMMTANERFIVVNTKTGNLIGSEGTRGASQGLLVIDLQEHDESY